MFDPTESWLSHIFRYAIWAAIIIGGVLYLLTAYPDRFWPAASFGLSFLAVSWLVQEWIVDPITRRIASVEYELQCLRAIDQDIDASRDKVDGLSDRLLKIEMER